ncbi:cytochrome b/b6 domain-containing protein [Paraburkholderia youngii]|uniref:cytochrome b/b6 domain-containing protein n=1 Tax=Paraburkholderia youngii TaxID=2782701 RepID=UPI0028A84838|nr:cytochrome b/b6 domain-containing protein [Paraburkholderia youngii]
MLVRQRIDELFRAADSRAVRADRKATPHSIGEAHDLVGWAIIVIAAVHAAAALLHHYVLRDEVFKRVLPGKPGGT